MGNSRFDDTAYRSYSDTHQLKSASRAEVFTSSFLPEALNPAKITVRESCDSDANPESTPVVMGLDVTGSMGFVAERIAKEQLPSIMTGVVEQSPVSDPHLMFLGIGDVNSDRAPLQASQFEADALELIKQLRTLYLEGNGGGNGYESYDLLWYFLAHKTKVDCLKRGVKGFGLTLGDELPPQRSLTEAQIQRVFGGDHPAPGTTAELLALAQQTWRIFHLVIEEGSYAQGHLSNVRGQWTELLGPNAIFVRDIAYLPDIIVAALKIAAGADLHAVIESYDSKAELKYAFANAISSYKAQAEAAE